MKHELPRADDDRSLRSPKTQENRGLPPAFLQNRILVQLKLQRSSRFRILHGRKIKTVEELEAPAPGRLRRRFNEADKSVQTLDICQGICHTLMMSERHVKLFKNGRNQAVRIPREFELPGEDAIIRKEGQRLIIEAAPPRSLLAVLATLQTIDENFPPIEDLPAEPVDL